MALRLGKARRREPAPAPPAPPAPPTPPRAPEPAPQRGITPEERSTGFEPVAVDLRRRDTRDWAETIAARAEHLLPDDRALLRAVFRDGMDAKRVARLQGRNPRTVRRRVRALAARVLSPEFEFVLTRREGWPRARRLVATACVLQGRTLREAAAHLRITLHTVRRQMDLVRALQDEGRAR